ncbi:DNA repair protein recA homolog 2, mitochondrial-like [Actinidia eriantha]|uniref:DNA repair protein recA homolog 2, mitochondrial-like n=1 Tax=Actinidia eriantha TaxID=165200 RepID=UPI00258EA8EF|nr:DNA repair protein recA homolog 2, mitochondrial-like [Actinidia eriantha]
MTFHVIDELILILLRDCNLSTREQIELCCLSKTLKEHETIRNCGNALRFYAAIRMRISRTGLLKTEDKVTGLGICVQVLKNKLAPPMKKLSWAYSLGEAFAASLRSYTWLVNAD